MNTPAKIFVGAAIGLGIGYAFIVAISWLGNLIVSLS